MGKTSWSLDKKISGTVIIGLLGLVISFFSWISSIERKVSVLDIKLKQVMMHQAGRDVRQDEDMDRIERTLDRVVERR